MTPGTPPTAPWIDRIAAVVDHVEQHLEDELDAARLAMVSGFSLHHFHRVFRGVTGESVMGFVRRLRLERAAQQLKYQRTPVTSVAFDVGYGSHEAFTRAFRARFGMPPSAYRLAAAPKLDPGQTTVREEPERHCLSLRHVGSYDECGLAWETVAGILGPAGVLAHETASLGLCYDDPEVTATEQLRYDACVALPESVLAGMEIPEGFVRRTVPAGRYAVTEHRGPFDSLPEVYVSFIGSWLPQRGVELAHEPVVERYVVGPEAAEPDDCVTEICVRLK